MAFNKSVFVSVLLTVGLICAGCNHTPKSTIKSFYFELERNHISQAKSYLSSRLVQRIGDKELDARLAWDVREISSCGGLNRIVVNLASENIEEDFVGGAVMLTYKGSCPHRINDVSLHRENGNIKIFSMRKSKFQERIIRD